MIAVIIGATGLVGSTVLEKIIKRDEFSKIILISRKPITANDSRVEVVISDLNQLSKIDLKLPDSVFISCLGTTIKKAGNKEDFYRVDHNGTIEFAKLGIRSGAKKFILISALGANPKSSFFYNRVKGQVEDDIKKLGFKSLVIFQPGLLIGERKEVRFAERISIKVAVVLSHILGPNMIAYMATSVAILALAVIDMAISFVGDYKLVKSGEIGLWKI